MKSESAENKLFTIAESQQGYFTTRQAKTCGYKDNTHSYHTRSGDWIRVYRGIYRLAKFPHTERPDLMIWTLWSSNRKGKIEGIYSHQTALAIHHLSDVMPHKLHMTIPLSFRRNSPTPPVLILHSNNLQKDEIMALDGYFVTTPFRTILDIIEDMSISHDLIIQAISNAYQNGLLTRAMIKRLLKEPTVQNSPLYSYLRGL